MHKKLTNFSQVTKIGKVHQRERKLEREKERGDGRSARKHFLENCCLGTHTQVNIALHFKQCHEEEVCYEQIVECKN